MVEYQVSVEPNTGTVKMRHGETVMGGAERLGYLWPTVCGGLGQCRVCVMEVVAGESSLSPPDEREMQAILSTFGSQLRRGRPLRQACQAKVTGEGVGVFKRGVRPAVDR